ncbi:MAG: indolepyruvate ferredoxin oxidoreductase subunit alpha [Theionarchaea archaeon]|nr:indolepyruvate ferredoxin oxidoreductase subunit alpha [Theionarchaea archaeon]MBU7001531.1 indolepyruvate ferredoxin oxidoreductase subunit alpha [Theionarchaea archaeon]MBU7021390.1 indolepyruvate ferredoxin oxidoreductase subunit alpha [Theionarchaea archaeon]MBU7041030.1 indolepyruvate ferredoxin oxidoreductase subunit alpha [Theionarchaea archaeon]
MKELLMGNEAIARGAVEAGVKVVAAYPGTPSSEIPNTISKIAKKYGIYFEWSTNEKVAYEVAFAGAVTGLRSMVTMKHVGLNVASDAFMASAEVGVEGGYVVVSADDPSLHSSQNEQDNRYYARLANIPCIEPGSPQEAKDYTIKAFEISEQYKMPVMLRTTTRVNHTRGDVELGDILSLERTPKFEKNPRRYVTVPTNARVLRENIIKKMDSFKSDLDTIEGKGSLGVIASGIAYNYVKETLLLLDVEAEIYKVAVTHPLSNAIIDFLNRHDDVIVVEELEPIVETEVRSMAQKENIPVTIYGKDIVPRAFELNTTRVANAFRKYKNLPLEEVREFDIPARPPILCPGCPHRASFYAIRKAAPKGIYPSGIGCYTLGFVPPLSAVDSCLCMGASIGFSCGLSEFVSDKIICTIGDSSFFHAGIPPLLDAVYNKHTFVVMILDNETTAMTGHQPHPGTGITGMGESVRKIYPEKLTEAMGIKTDVVDPHDVKRTIEVLKEAVKSDELRVVIARRKCIFLEGAERKNPYVVTDECTGCRLCLNQLGCPAIEFVEGKAVINELCNGCGVCAQICPSNAITGD